MEEVVKYILSKNGIGDKSALAKLVKKEFGLTVDGKVYYSSDYALRFSSSKNNSFSNTVLALSRLQKYDDTPFIVCLVTPVENKLFLANTSFLKKVSHSSQELRRDNIKGSFNGSDIIRSTGNLSNDPKKFLRLVCDSQELYFQRKLGKIG